jgi:hypothetical protein
MYYNPDTKKGKAECKRRVALLEEFIRRVPVANMNLAPRGPLQIVVEAETFELTEVRIVDFIAWARGLGWDLPEEFLRCALPNDKKVEDKPLKTTERNTLLTIVAALCGEHSDININDHGASTKIARMIERLGVQVSDDTVRRYLNKIPNALESRKK